MLQIPLHYEVNFIYNKISKHLKLMPFLFGDLLITYNLSLVEKLSVFVTYVTIEVYIFRKQTFGF